MALSPSELLLAKMQFLIAFKWILLKKNSSCKWPFGAAVYGLRYKLGDISG